MSDDQIDGYVTIPKMLIPPVTPLRNNIPRAPQCRCSVVPVGVAEGMAEAMGRAMEQVGDDIRAAHPAVVEAVREASTKEDSSNHQDAP